MNKGIGKRECRKMGEQTMHLPHSHTPIPPYFLPFALPFFLFIGILLIVPFPTSSHVILDPEVVRKILFEIDKDHKDSKEGPNNEAKAEALYRLGEKVQGLVELLNQDFSAHGMSDLLAQFLLKRLEAYEARITFSEQERRYVYDLAAFREYLSRTPKGKHAPNAKFQLIARTFYETLGTDPSKLVKTDVSGLMKAVAEEEQFLKEYPQHERAKEVRFFLAVDYYRLLKNIKDPEKAKGYRWLCQEALEQMVERYPETIEARAAEALLEGLRSPERN